MTVHVVDDDPGVCVGVASVLAELDCRVECHGDAESFLDAFCVEQPECLILDIGLPGMGGLQLLRRLARDSIQLPTVMLSAATDVGNVVTAIQSGAAGFIEKPPVPSELLAAVQGLFPLAMQMATARARLRRLLDVVERLTDREREVFALLGEGLSAKQVAHRLGLSVHTAHIHRRNVLLKIGVETPLELVQAANELRAARERAEA